METRQTLALTVQELYSVATVCSNQHLLHLLTDRQHESGMVSAHLGHVDYDCNPEVHHCCSARRCFHDLVDY